MSWNKWRNLLIERVGGCPSVCVCGGGGSESMGLKKHCKSHVHRFAACAERARRRKEARMEKERQKRGQDDHFNEDLIPY